MEENLRIGLIVNPIAGMGGPVGLKGTDDVLEEALRRGAKPVAPLRARIFLSLLSKHISSDSVYFLVAPGIMGEDYIKNTGFRYKVVGKIHGSRTARHDTIRITREMLREGIDLLVFVGGDGTARDILEALDRKVPVLGVPSGVKMYSGVFAVTPYEASQLIRLFIEGVTTLKLGEVLDVDEEAFRNNRLEIRLYGYLLVPSYRDLIQLTKEPSSVEDEYSNMISIAKYIVENLIDNNTVYILGPGTTLKVLGDVLGIEKTLLGVDVYFKGKIIAKDADRATIERIVHEKGMPVKIIVTPIGGQGFVFGRGNQQISPNVIKYVGRDGLIFVATRRKIRRLKKLRVDTGDRLVDEMLKGYVRVLVDYGEYVMMKIE